MKKIILLFFLILSVFANAQNVESPEQFLGYKLGTKFTRHDKIVSYFQYVASVHPEMVKIEKYGETNEGRTLLLAYIALPENSKKLEAIRENNLRLAGLLKDNTPVNTDAPAIVWLSYNVHGNEAASSEAAMLTLYALVSSNNLETKEWLKNTIIIIDPCINPDGRDRYINWYNTTVGKNYNPDPQSREHNEPWPGGRTNHYNFDLNRDWVWQTQVESKFRLKKYNEWLPQVHVDYHEQGYNEPYYFAPAAEPYHDVITQWQRNFQELIGKNNAKYFDAKNWLFFTKERFDLFYPSYGDTYPLYNGSIGMTFEQGGIRAGLGIINKDGDTLTLVDRIQHHYTTGISTIEVSSMNAQQLIKEYVKYFNNNRNATNTEYKTYVITSNDANKILAVKELLDKNKIEYGTMISEKIKGYRYFTGKEEEFQLKNYTLAVSAYQTKGSLARVLFESKSKLSDSATYDITAWSIPYAYNVEGIALKEKKELSPFSVKYVDTIPKSEYGYLIPYHSLNAAKLLSFLLKNNIKVRIADKPFVYNNKSYDRGTLLVLKTSNKYNQWNELLEEASKRFNIAADAVMSGLVDSGADFGSPDIRPLNAPRVALITGQQTSATDAGEVWNFFEQCLDYPLTLINANDVSWINLTKYDVLILPDGYYHSLNDKTILDKLKEFVKNGGKLIAIQGAVMQIAKNDWGIKLQENKEEKNVEDNSMNVKKYADRERNDLSDFIPGSIYKVELDNTHPLAYGFNEFYFTLKQDAENYELLKDDWNVGVIKKDNYVAGFVGYRLKKKLKDGVLIGVEDIDKGQFIFFADNPIFRMFWESGKQLLANAVFLTR